MRQGPPVSDEAERVLRPSCAFTWRSLPTSRLRWSNGSLPYALSGQERGRSLYVTMDSQLGGRWTGARCLEIWMWRGWLPGQCSETIEDVGGRRRPSPLAREDQIEVPVGKSHVRRGGQNGLDLDPTTRADW